MNFKIGDRVVALTNPVNEYGQPRIKGQIYRVYAVVYCSGCGCQSINIGVKSQRTKFNCGCGKHNQPNGGLWFTTSANFALVDEQTLTEAVESENYELAEVIHRELKALT